MTLTPIDSPPSGEQRVLNESVPRPDVLRRAHVRPFGEQLAVRVRVVLADDGEQWLSGVATRWMRLPQTHVRVMVNDPRVPGGGLWVGPVDVEAA